MTGFVPTELRVCSACKKDYVTAVVTEEDGGELTVWEEPCPYCRVAPTPAGDRRRNREVASR